MSAGSGGRSRDGATPTARRPPRNTRPSPRGPVGRWQPGDAVAVPGRGAGPTASSRRRSGEGSAREAVAATPLHVDGRPWSATPASLGRAGGEPPAPPARPAARRHLSSRSATARLAAVGATAPVGRSSATVTTMVARRSRSLRDGRVVALSARLSRDRRGRPRDLCPRARRPEPSTDDGAVAHERRHASRRGCYRLDDRRRGLRDRGDDRRSGLGAAVRDDGRGRVGRLRTTGAAVSADGPTTGAAVCAAVRTTGAAGCAAASTTGAAACATGRERPAADRRDGGRGLLDDGRDGLDDGRSGLGDRGRRLRDRRGRPCYGSCSLGDRRDRLRHRRSGGCDGRGRLRHRRSTAHRSAPA